MSSRANGMPWVSLLGLPLAVSLAGSMLLLGCGPTTEAVVCNGLRPGDLVVSEVFADFAAPVGQSGADAGNEWFEIYNASGSGQSLTGLTIVHSRSDGTREVAHTITEGDLAAGGYWVAGNVAPDLRPSWVQYGYGDALGEMYNTGEGKLSLRCGGAEIDSAIYSVATAGQARQFDGSVLPEYLANDDSMRWCEGSTNEFVPANFGTPGEKSDCVPVLAGMCNDNGTMRATVPPLAGQLVITEFMASPAKVSDTLGEWFEVQALADVDLNGIGLDRQGDSAAPNVVTAANCLRLSTGSFALFAKNDRPADNGMLPAVQGTFTFSMVTGSAATPGDIAVWAGATLVDAVRWTKSSSGKSRALDSATTDAIANDEESNFCDGVMPYGLGDTGTPGAANARCGATTAGMCNDNGTMRPIVKPALGALVITEFMAQPAGTDSDEEWFEVQNSGTTAFDLNGLTLDRQGDTAAGNLIVAADCKTVAAGGFAVFAHKTDAAVNGGLPPVTATFSFSMPAAGDLAVLDGTTVLDAITYTNAPANASRALDPDATTTAGNDDVANFCDGSMPYGPGVNRGTPGTANAQCP